MLTDEIVRQLDTTNPPMAISNVVLRARIEPRPLDVELHVRLVDNPAAGALVTFAGQVRDHDGGRRVRTLEYSAHPSAEAVLAELASTVAATRSGLRGIAVSHRIGQLAIGDVALCVVVAADHRRQAFDACGELVEEVKRNLPVWKLQALADGLDEWVGSA